MIANKKARQKRKKNDEGSNERKEKENNEIVMGMNKKRESEMTSTDVIAEAILRIQKRPKS